MRRKYKLAMGSAVAVALLAAVYPWLTVTSYTVESEKLAPGQHFRLAVVTDLHSHIYSGRQQALLDKIWAGKPDAVMLVGDIYDERIEPTGVALLLEGLKGKTPLFYVTGGHEYKTGKIEAVLEFFEGYGVTVLRDSWLETRLHGVPVVIGGTDEPARRAYLDASYDPYAAMAQAFADLPRDRFSLLLAHRPEMVSAYSQYPFDLVLSGHAHGGQVRIPFIAPGGLFAPNQGILPQYAGGRYTHGGMTHIVSRGLSVFWYLPRVLNPPELVLVEVRAPGDAALQEG